MLECVQKHYNSNSDRGAENAEAEKMWAAQRTRFAEAEKTGFAKDNLTYKEEQQQKPIDQQKAEPILFA